MSIFYCLSKRKRWLLLLLVLLSLQSKAFTQDSSRITVQGNNIPIETALRQIEKQSGFSFVYGKPTLDDTERITVDISGKGFTAVMDALLGARGIVWSFRGGVVVLSRRGEDVKMVADTVPRITVTGTVVDRQGKAVPGSTVMVKGTKLGTQSDGEGRFVLANIPADAVLVIRSIGYEGKQVKVGGKSIVPIVLSEAVTELKNVEVVSTGYQDIPKERATGSFVQINNELYNRQLGANALERIFNVTSGLNYTPGKLLGAGNESDKTSFTIRGLSTINSSTKPLIIVDNFPFEGDISLLNPNDVQSVTVLRDAAAASIWGVRAGNGVVVITTKKGRYNQNNRIQVTSNLTIGEKPNIFSVPLMSSVEAIEVQIDLFKRGFYNEFDDSYPSSNYFPVIPQVAEILLKARKDGIIDPLNNEVIKTEIGRLADGDIRKDIDKYLLQPSLMQQYAVNFSGGGSRYNYYSAIGYDRNRSDRRGDKTDRLSVRFDNSFQPINNLEVNGYIVYTQGNATNNGLDYQNFMPDGKQVSPYTSLVGRNGEHLNIPWYLPGLRQAYIDTASFPNLQNWNYNPLNELSNSNNTGRQTDVRIGAGAKYRILDGFTVEIKYQYQKVLNELRNEYSTSTFYTRDLINRYMYVNSSGRTVYPIPLGSILNVSQSHLNTWNLRGQLNFNRDWGGRHEVATLGGWEAREINTMFDSNTLYGYDPKTNQSQPIDNVTIFQARPGGEMGPIKNSFLGGGGVNRFISYFANGSYTFLDRYSVSVSGRLDQSNFFGVDANNKRVPLWSGGLGWELSNENFYNVKWLPYAKFRFTFGYNGNTNNSGTSYPIITYNSALGIASVNGEPFARLVNAPNPQLRWEKVRVANFGLDFSTKDQRVSGTIEFYRKDGIDLISSILVDPTTGVKNYIGNNASIKGTGFDFTFSTINMIRGRFKWMSSLLVSRNIDRVVSYAVEPNSTNEYFSESVPVVGRSLYKIYAYKWAGLDPTDGAPKIYIGDSITTANNYTAAEFEDLVYGGNTLPKYFGSIINTFEYKRFSISFNVTYKLGYFFRRQSILFGGLSSNSAWGGHGDYSLRWRKPGDELVTNVPSFSVTNNSQDRVYTYSSVLIEKGGHFRLQDFRISYSLRDVLSNKSLTNNASIFLYATNLGILWRANKNNFDPDFGYVKPPRTIALGATLNL